MTKTKSRFAALLAATALLIAAIGTVAVFKLTGALGTTRVVHTTAVVAGNEAVSTNSGSGVDAQSLYTSASPGVVDITTGRGSGTGFVVDGQGHIVTAEHVVQGGSSITVKFQDGTTRKATVLGTDDATDIAVLKVDPTGLTLHPLTLGSSSRLQVGDTVAAIGDPFGYDRSFSTGIISGLDRTISAPNGFTVAHAVQTDTALNPGNSGGPMLDANGKVIGVVDQIATDGSADQSSGVGFAVPIDLVKSELQTLEAGKNVQHAYIGVATSDTTSATPGALVGQVTPGGPASAAGVKAGDVVTAIDGQKINGASDLVATVAAHKPGAKLAVTIDRNGKTLQLTITLGVQPSTSPSSGR
jgi:putative serine protease PepD